MSDPGEIAIGGRVEMTFRKLFTADGIHNYFWKGRLVRSRSGAPAAQEDHSMGSHGIKDRVAIVGMGCTPLRRALGQGRRRPARSRRRTRPYKSAGVVKDDVDAFWLGTAMSGMSGMMLAKPLQLEGKPVTRVENFCATGSEALRQAAYAVASGAYDVAMAIGVEKVKDSGYQGLNAFPIPTDGTDRTLTAAAMFSMVAPAYAKKYGVSDDEMRTVLATIASKNHFNGARNPRAQFRREMSVEQLVRDAARRGTALGVRLRRCRRRRRGRDRRARRGRRAIHPEPALHQGTVVRRRERQRADRPVVRLHDVPGDRRVRAGRVRASRASPIRAASSRWRRCTTASRRPSSC